MPFFSTLIGKTGYEAVSEDLPTITDGIASGFDDTTGIQTNLDFNPGSADEWEIHTCVNISGVRSPYQMVIGTRGFGMDFTLDGNRRCKIYVSSTGNSWDIANGTIGTFVTPLNEWTYYKLKKTRTKLIVYCSSDDSNWSEDISINMTSQIKCSSGTYAKRVGIGYLNQNNPAYLRGSLDLNKTYIKINNTPWFGTCPIRVKVNSGLAKYTKVGNPTINNEIVSGFSKNNYLTLNTKFNPGNSPWEIVLKSTTGSDFSTRNTIIKSSTTDNTTKCIQFGIEKNNRSRVFCFLSSNGSSWDICSKNVDIQELDIDSVYWFKLSFTGDTYKFSVSTDGEDWTDYIIVTSSLSIYPWYIFLGYNWASYPEVWTGSFDLKHSYIKIGNSYFWRGSDYYQNLDHYKINQDNFSKYYTIIDGKLTWANPNIYLENTSLSKIDTGISSTDYSSLDFTLKTSVTTLGASTSQTSVIFGSNTGDVSYIGYRVNDSKYLCGGDYRNFGTKITDINHLTGTISNYGTELSLTDNNITITCSGGSSSNYNYNLFCTGTNNPADYRYAKARIYSGMTMSVNGVKLRHFVPVPKGLLIGNFIVPSNGMFDIVTQTFYGNAGTGEFEIGGIPDDYIIEGGKMIWCNPDISLENNSNWSAYINTGIIPTNDMRFQTLSEVTDSASHDGCLLGCRVNASTGTTGKQFVLWYGNYSGNTNSGSLVYGGSAAGKCNFNLGTLQKTQLDYDGTYFYLQQLNIWFHQHF